MAYTLPADPNSKLPQNRGWKWAAIGSLVGGLFAFPWGAGIMVGSGLLGYLSGKNQVAEEVKSGTRIVQEPTFWNDGLAKGFLWGGVIGTLIGVAVGAAVLLATGGTAAVAAGFLHTFAASTVMTAAPAYLGTAIGLGTLAGMTTNAVMMYKGSVSRRDEMRDDYMQAQLYQRPQTSQNRSVQPTTQRIQEQQMDYGPNHPSQGKSAEHFRNQYQQRTVQPGSPALNTRG